jgi:CopG family transcriptional regulator, nickel-responsive regulator
MQRITITIDDDLLQAVDDLITRKHYGSRSEAMRDIIREMLNRERLDEAETDCVAALTFIFDHDIRNLPHRIASAHHERHDLSIASMHVHLNHESCMQVTILRGALREVQGFADSVGSQRGVRSAQLHLIPAKIATADHTHGETRHSHEHVEI